MPHRTPPPGILLAAYGATAKPATLALESFAEQVRAAFPGHETRLAYTGESPATGPQGGRKDVGAALSLLRAGGCARIAVQPLHVTRGSEHASLASRIQAWRTTHPDVPVRLGRPLLDGEESMLRAIRIMRGVSPAGPGEETVWIGHGNAAPGFTGYTDMAVLAAARATPVLMGCITGSPGFDHILEILERSGKTRLCLLPFFALYGRHAARDINGNNRDSWRSRLESRGFSCRSVLRGLVEYEDFAAMWIDRLREALREVRA